ncbi:MAG: ribonuclease P protein component [Chloroflexota bacterium]
METLKNSGQFERVRREGRTWGAGLLVLNAARNGQDVVRCGFITGKKIGNAVKRNRARRLIREAVRRRLPEIKAGWDLVWIARAPIEGASFEAVCRAVDDLLQRSRVVAPLAGSETGAPHNSQNKPISQRAETVGAQSRIIDSAGSQSAASSGDIVEKNKPAPRQ